MLDWTGERFVPWASDPVVAYEHLHRYFWASGLVKGKKVLDLACGEGYGADLLARQAVSVCALDIDEDAVRHASKKYRRPNLQFFQGSITAVPITENCSFDVITCFEAIEHIEQHDELIQEVRRLLKPGGLFAVSTPNKDAYNAQGEPANPFHVRELTFEEFDTLLTRYFPNVRYFGQRVHPASSMWSIGHTDGKALREFAVERRDGEFRPVIEPRTPIYYVAIASGSGIPECEGSVLLDSSDERIREKDREVEVLLVDLHQREEALEWRKHQVEHLENEIKQLEDRLERVRQNQRDQITLMQKDLEWFHQSLGWRLVSKWRAWRNRLTESVG